MLTTNQIGAVTETAIIHEAVRFGIGVFKPVMDERCDLILDLRPTLLRVQCKTAVKRDDVLVVSCYSSRRSASGLLKRIYTAEEIDAVAAYCAELRRCFFLPMSWIGARRSVQLRLANTRNNQRQGVNWADDFDFAATLSRLKGP